MEALSPELVAHIKHLYHQYRHTTDLERKGLFFSPDCLQICRPIPAYAATSRDHIVQYLRDAEQGKIPIDAAVNTEHVQLARDAGRNRDLYTIRPLEHTELEFEPDEVTQAIGMTSENLRRKAEVEKWVGMRVDLWSDGVEGGLLAKVQYCWRLEDIPDSERTTGKAREWRQCLHDIMYLGPRDGTEGGLDLEVLE
ncbi:hypothetical protein NX059_000766 [Plenodomus lindquistii]|nr:hypothetical protein NX059_000766 [Plenodomus lindquistii]